MSSLMFAGSRLPQYSCIGGLVITHVRTPSRGHVVARSRLFTAAGLSLALALGACASDGDGDGEAVGSDDGSEVSEDEIEPGGTINVGIPGDPGNLDPTFANTLTSVSVYSATCEYLYNTTADGEVFPQLAAGPPEFNDEGDVATISLREGVVFSDGSPLNAEAVEFTIDRYKTAEGSQRTNELDAVSSIEVVDDLTFRVHFDGAIAPGAFDVIFTDRSGIIISPTAVEELGDEGFAAEPVCVGPFVLDSRIAQDSITLAKNENYYDADSVHLDQIVYRVIPDSNVRTTNLRSGDLQVIERVATTDVATLEGAAETDVLSHEGLGFINLEYNVGNVGEGPGQAGAVDTPVGSNPNVRRALEMSIDREAINQVVYSGQFSPACGFMAPSSVMASEQTLSCTPYDPEAARDLLESTGVDLPVRAELMLNQQPELRRMGEMIQSMAAETGFEIVLDIAESTATVERGYGGDFEIYINSWSGRVDPDANISLFAKSDSPRSMGQFNNTRADELLETARTATSEEERIAAYDELDTILKEEVPYTFLVRPSNLVGIRSNVVGVDMRANGTAVVAHAAFQAG